MNIEDDSKSYTIFAAVLGALVLFTVFIGIVANKYSPASNLASDPLVAAQQQQRLMPVGQSRIAE